MGRYTKHRYLHKDLLHELITPERDHTQRSLEHAKQKILEGLPYRVLSRPEDFTRPYGRTIIGLKSAAAAAASLTAKRQNAVNIDGRSYHPAGSARPYMTTKGAAATVSPQLKEYFKPHIFRSPSGAPLMKHKVISKIAPLAQARRLFNLPNAVIPCIQRNVRKQVLIALGAGGSHKKKRKTPSSDIGC